MSKNNVKFSALALVICGMFAYSQYSARQQYKGFVKINNTQSGMFIITNDRIYTVNELETDEPVKVASIKSR